MKCFISLILFLSLSMSAYSATFKTYENKKLRLRFDYPAESKMALLGKSQKQGEGELLFLSKQDNPFVSSITITVKPKTEFKDVWHFSEAYLRNLTASMEPERQKLRVTKNKLNLHGKEAREIALSHLAEGELHKQTLLFEEGKNQFVIVDYSRVAFSGEQDLPIYEKIKESLDVEQN